MRKFYLLILSACFVTSFVGAETPVSNRLVYDMSSDQSEKGFSGDMRIRYQHDLTGLKTIHTGAFIRARLGWAGHITDRASWAFKIGAGSLVDSRDDQRFEGFGIKPLFLDTTYISYLIGDHTTFYLGKMSNPYYDHLRYNLVWDEDLRPEGASIRYSREIMSNSRLNINASAFLRDVFLEDFDANRRSAVLNNVNKLKSKSASEILAAGSASISFNYDEYSFRTGAAFYNVNSHGDLAGELSSVSKEESVRVGNSTMGQSSNKYATDFSTLDVFLQLTLKSFFIPVSTYIQFIQNFSSSNDSVGMVAGGLLGDKMRVNSWALGYNYFRLDKDAVMAKYTDSDVGGFGANYQGHQVHLSYLVTKYFDLGARYILRFDKTEGYSNKPNHTFFGSVAFRF